MEYQANYWHIYYDRATIERSEQLRQEFCVETTGIQLHVDAYLQPDRSARTILINHGWGSYARMFVNHALNLYDQGYSVLVADQRGQGFSTPAPDFHLKQLVQDVLDVSHWSRRSFDGPLFMVGVNQGGALAYHASTLGAPVVGLILHQLYDFGSVEEALARSRYAGLLGVPGGARLASAAAKTLMAVSPSMRLGHETIERSDGILDERDNGRYEAWLEDPFPARSVSLHYAVSSFSSPSLIPYEDNRLPVLVINPIRDRISAPEVTRKNYERLGGPKTYVEMDYGHWSMTNDFARRWAGFVNAWVKRLLD